jgi:predicted nucleic acid-binding protein
VIVLSDASPLITLAEAGYLETLAGLYKSIVITPEVYHEVAVAGEGLAGALQIATASWIQVRAPGKMVPVAVAQAQSVLGAGELSTIVLARELSADLTIMDDRQARRLAEKQGLVVFGCVGVLETAFRHGLITGLTAAYRKLIASEAYINPEILKASLARLKQPPL